MALFSTPRRLVTSAILFVAVVGAGAFAGRFLRSASEAANRRASTVETSHLEVLGAENGVIDLGEQPRGTVRRLKATVRNVSDDRTIRVSRISSSCACTVLKSGAFAIPPGGTHVIDYSVAAPANEPESAVSLYLMFDGGDYQEIPIHWRSPEPFPDSVALEGGDGVFLPLSPAYRPHAADVKVYPHLEEEALFSRLDLERGGVFVEHVPDGTQTLDVVVAIEGAAEDEPNRVIQYVHLLASEAGSDGL